MPERERRWNGWGFLGEVLPVPESARGWLDARIGRGDPLRAIGEDEVEVPPARSLPEIPAPLLDDRTSRLRHACGHSFPDLLALRTGALAGVPDAVVLPESAAQVVEVLRAAQASGVEVVIRGGGTSVVGGVSVVLGERPCVVLSLERLTGLLALDVESRLATFAAGTLGPDLEAALAPHRLRLGHEPQSFELSTLGGWIAARSAGQRSTGVGKIEDLVAGLEVAGFDGLWRLPPLPASAAGPELRRLLAGSEGRLGVITEATVRVLPQPAEEDGAVVLMPSWQAGMETCRAILHSGVPVEVMRLSDPSETAFAQTLLELSPLAARASRLLFGLRRFRAGCALLLGWAGDEREVARGRWAAAEQWRARGGLGVGRGGFARWRRDRFRHPYLRDSLLDLGWGVDTLETAAPWSALERLWQAVRAALERAAGDAGTRAVTLCHLSHSYPDGASLYFTFFWTLVAGREAEQWAALKQAATEALLAAGGTVSHHHGVGTMHAPWLRREAGRQGIEALRALAAARDPHGLLNPGVMILPEAPSGAEKESV